MIWRRMVLSISKSLIEELKQRYPRKPALLDELEKVEKRL